MDNKLVIVVEAYNELGEDVVTELIAQGYLGLRTKKWVKVINETS